MHGCCLEDAAQGSCCCMLICCPSISCWFLESCGGGWQALDHCSTLEHSPALGMSGVTTVWAWDGDGGGCSVLAVGRKCPKAMLEGSCSVPQLLGSYPPCPHSLFFSYLKPHCCCMALCLLGYHPSLCPVVEATSGDHLRSLPGPMLSCWALLCTGQNLHLTPRSSGCCSCCPKWG